ncbi:MAG: type III polyketide synthase [Geminicoccaceae bacterium]|nr:type III polyketide synthase [Geminicoccaceae bacterium]MCX7630945.1 type III polyketide synthase [Geminicoccaceae bacterium]MDW8123235.1 3-oxoacyl-[acyl-carrier-protein] synthase III C-terminal domain-containing protein [Geminicoccaceae bacterium]
MSEVALLALASANPPHLLTQAAAKEGARRLFGGRLDELERRLRLFDRCGIERRRIALPLDAYLEPAGFGRRNALFLASALALLEDATRRALAAAGLEAEAIDAVVTVCSTGIATPSLEAHLAERLGLRADVLRAPLFGLGCAGGVQGLARAADFARARPGSRVLLLVVELCSLTLRLSDASLANLVACALFGDGAAVAILSSAGTGPRIGPTGEHRFRGTLEVMGWRVEDDGLGVLFAPTVPEIARSRLGGALAAFLERQGLAPADVDRWLCHPGGAKVLSALEEVLPAPAKGLEHARAVLAEFGNMSAPTVLFVLDRALAEPDWKRALLLALGPGFTAAFAIVER